MRRCLLIFLKLPTPGSVKTRLAKSIGSKEAVKAYKSLVSNVFEIVRPAPIDDVRILFTPADDEPAIRAWLDPQLEPIQREGIDVAYFPQAEGDLGLRLEVGFDEAFTHGADQVAAIGTDCIDITPQTFRETWSALDENSGVVFGPTEDGGYYLVALSKNTPEVFRDIPWSTPDTLKKSVATAIAKGIPVSFLETLHDIDEIQDWIRVRDRFESGGFEEEASEPETDSELNS